MKTKILPVLVLIAFFPTLHAADPIDEKGFQKLMKEVGKVAKDFRNNAQARNAAVIEKDAAHVADIYKQMAAYWRARKVEDAAKLSDASAGSASATAVAAKAGDWDKVRTSWGAVGKNCKECHDAHREKLPNGGYKIK